MVSLAIQFRDEARRSWSLGFSSVMIQPTHTLALQSGSFELSFGGLCDSYVVTLLFTLSEVKSLVSLKCREQRHIVGSVGDV